jgi:Domain of unknown function (DUF4259)
MQKLTKETQLAAWSANSFGNDAAMDWLDFLSDGGNHENVADALKDITEAPQEEFLDATVCCQAIAAAEIVACALETPPEQDFPEQAKVWLEENPFKVTEEMAALAINAIDRIAIDSELKEYWEDSDARDEWYKALEDLKLRLAAFGVA